MPKKEKKWHAFMTTAPRRDCTLQLAVESTRTAGWEPIVYAEPGSSETDAKTVKRTYRHGAWCNWLSAAEDAVKTDADYILSLQDDILFHPKSKKFAEKILFPHPKAAFVSLYTAKHYSIRDGRLRPPGIIRVNTRALWGACALVFPRLHLKTILRSSKIRNWLGIPPRDVDPDEAYKHRSENPETIANVDSAISLVASELQYGMYFVNPSLVEHIAFYSSISHGDNTGKRNSFKPLPHNVDPSSTIPLPIEIYDI